MNGKMRNDKLYVRMIVGAISNTACVGFIKIFTNILGAEREIVVQNTPNPIAVYMAYLRHSRIRPYCFAPKLPEKIGCDA